MRVMSFESIESLMKRKGLMKLEMAFRIKIKGFA